MTIIAIDAMGGDQAPKAIIEGLSIFHQRCPRPAFLLYGDEALIHPLLSKHTDLAQVCKVIHTDEKIDGHMKPSQALRSMPRSSMRLALEAVAQGEAAGIVSAGNTGAYLALSRSVLKTLRGISRPAIASQFPTEKGEVVMLDLGGSLEATSLNLVEYALMGHTFARTVLKLSQPTVGLLNVGKEDSKGNDRLQRAFSALKNMGLHFHGFIEGNDITSGAVSIVVTDGFTGNVALKTAEGTAELLFSSLKKCLLSGGLRGKVSAWLARPFFKELVNHFDPRSYNGAVWLGLNGVAVKSHGSADAIAFAYAVEMAADMIEAEIVKEIDEALYGWEEKASVLYE